ncbi:hypothetical protein EYF80_012073 [Liparis tanakae]|uniref:Uncharacterized protein n=1 Tax=Liparis tanakae TaxID=230148 RepID=A0A4Z2IJ23_9TELE|nr:hypothetical protein EYF80_012073 [Liparis tanakae]
MLRTSARTLVLEIDHTSLSSAKGGKRRGAKVKRSGIVGRVHSQRHQVEGEEHRQEETQDSHLTH